MLLRHHSEEESDWPNGESETELGKQLKLNIKGKRACRVGVIGWTKNHMNKQRLG